jgi:hypothetical protein
MKIPRNSGMAAVPIQRGSSPPVTARLGNPPGDRPVARGAAQFDDDADEEG